MLFRALNVGVYNRAAAYLGTVILCAFYLKFLLPKLNAVLNVGVE
jgi:hypothetical protein